MDADILVYDNAVEITGKLHFKDELKVKTGEFGPMASFAILIEKPKKNRMWKYYIYAKAFGDSLVEKIKRIQKGTFVRIIGELETYKMSMYINVKIITPISQSELEEMYDMHKEPEPEDIQETETETDILQEINIEELKNTEEVLEIHTEPEEEETKIKYEEPQKRTWGSGWGKKEKKGLL